MSRLPANVSRFTFEVIGQNEQFGVLAFEGTEALSSLFNYQVTVLCEHENLPRKELLGTNAALTLVDCVRATYRRTRDFNRILLSPRTKTI